MALALKLGLGLMRLIAAAGGGTPENVTNSGENVTNAAEQVTHTP